MSEMADTRLLDGDALVAEYLARNPDFLARHPEVLERLAPPQRWSGDRVVDMQQAMVARLRGEIDRLRNSTDVLIENTRTNMTVLERVHASVLALLEAKDPAELVTRLRDEVADYLDMAAVSMAFEYGPNPPRCLVHGEVDALDQGYVDFVLGPEGEALLRPDIQGEGDIYGALADQVRSDALVRLRPEGGPPGLLAIGARNLGEFAPEQATDLLLFLARCLERCVARWLTPL